jgi:hypothetical protein
LVVILIEKFGSVGICDANKAADPTMPQGARFDESLDRARRHPPKLR